MKSNIGNTLLLIAFGVILGFLVTLNTCSRQDNSSDKDIKIVTKIDTIYTPKHDTIVVSKVIPKPYKVVIIDTIYEKELLVIQNSYKDTIILKKDYKITYDATVTGTLDSITLGVIDNKPERIINTTITKTVYPKAIYAGVGISGNLQPFITASYIDRRQDITLDYSPTINLLSPSNFRVSYSRRVSLKR